MYDKEEIDKIVCKLELIKNKLLLNDSNILFVVTDWVINKKEVTNISFWDRNKKTIITKYYIESINMTWVGGSYQCTHKGVNTLLRWRNKWLNIKEQLKPVGYKLTKIQK